MANGLFNLKQVMQAVQQGGWPAQKPPAVEYLVVAGGGGANNGGGGAGGLLVGINPVPNGQALLVTVGGGGAGAVSGSSGNGANGSNSVFGSITSTGGGGGADQTSISSAGANGGSGGGQGFGRINNTNYFAGQGIVGQGNAGSLGYSDLSTYTKGGGGGGAGTISPYAGANNTGGIGGAGIASSISGTVTAYAGGGGGATITAGAQGTGGVGGGGAGKESGASNNGTANTGGGAGGNNTATGGAGGSGVVIVSYPDVYAAPIATTGGVTASTNGSGSSYFDGSTWADYPASTSNYATGDFTIEAWAYYNAFTSGYTLWFCMDPNSTYFGPTSATNTKLNLGTGGELSWTTSTISLNTWYHTAIVRNGTTITLYINGVSQGTNSSANRLGETGGAIRIGSASGYALNGYLSNLRYTKSAVYTSAFTPSTAPLTALANTRLLLNTVSPSPFNDSSGIAQTPTVTGTSSWNQLSPFATGAGYKNRVYRWTSSGSITF